MEPETPGPRIPKTQEEIMITRTKRNDIVTVEYVIEDSPWTVRVSLDSDDGFITLEPPFFHVSMLEEVLKAIRMAAGDGVPESVYEVSFGKVETQPVAPRRRGRRPYTFRTPAAEPWTFAQLVETNPDRTKELARIWIGREVKRGALQFCGYVPGDKGKAVKTYRKGGSL